MAIEVGKSPEDFKKEFLDPVSDSFCLAKWFEATIWLYIGQTASCHHNPTHKIKLDPKAPGSLHNTVEKIHERQSMRRGEKPKGCNYCWNAEETGVISDRVNKSKGYDTKLIAKAQKDDYPIPQKIEIAFDRTCNLACAYCEPKFSTTWANDIKKHGSYNLITNDRFNKDWKDELYKEEDNPYIDAFFQWWETLQHHLKVIRFTGGEPLLHKKFWDFLDKIDKEQTYRGSLIVNSNLIHPKGQVERFIEKTKFLWDDMVEWDMEHGAVWPDKIGWKPVGQWDRMVEIHTSCESNMTQAEFTRDGFKRDIWQDNVQKVLENSGIRLTFTTAINNMSVWSYVDYLKRVNNLRRDFGKHRIQINSNRVYHPQFHQVALIPQEYREELALELEEEFPKLEQLQDITTRNTILNHINFLKNSAFDEKHSPATEEAILQDMIKFLDQYLIRRGKTLKGLDPRYIEWVEQTRNRWLQNG